MPQQIGQDGMMMQNPGMGDMLFNPYLMPQQAYGMPGGMMPMGYGGNGFMMPGARICSGL